MKSPQSKTWSKRSHASPCWPRSFFFKSKISHLEGFHPIFGDFFSTFATNKARNGAVGNSNRDGCKYWNIRHKYHCWDPQRWRNLFFDDSMMKNHSGTIRDGKVNWHEKTVCILPSFFLWDPTQLTFFCWEGISLLLDMAAYGQVLGPRSDFVKL